MKIGDHILVDEKFPATIRYIGSVDGHNGQWIGIDWWNQQGKHNGTLNGKFYFQTKHPTSGSFIRKERIESGNSFTQAIYRQYVKSFSDENITDDVDYSIFGKKYSDYVINLSSIIRIDLSVQWVNEFDENEEIYKNLRQIKELNIRQNLLKTWSELWLVLDQYFPNVDTLNVSNSRMIFDKMPTKSYVDIRQIVLIDTDNDFDLFDNLFQYFPNLFYVHLDLNRITFLTENFVDKIQNLTNLSLSDNPTLKSWNPSVNYLGKLKNLEELILNNCGIEEILFPKDRDGTMKLFPSLKYLYLSDNKISSFISINELSYLPSLTSVSLLRNPIYPINSIECETVKQMIIAHLPNIVYLNRVCIDRDERRGAEIDYLQRYAQDYFDNNLNFDVEHRQYLKLIKKHGEPIKPDANQIRKKGLCIHSNLLKVRFEFADENEKRIEKKIPSSMTIAKLKTFVRKLFPKQLTNDIQINLFVLIDEKHKELMSNEYQDVDFYLGNCLSSQNNDQTSIIRIETVS